MSAKERYIRLSRHVEKRDRELVRVRRPPPIHCEDTPQAHGVYGPGPRGGDLAADPQLQAFIRFQMERYPRSLERRADPSLLCDCQPRQSPAVRLQDRDCLQCACHLRFPGLTIREERRDRRMMSRLTLLEPKCVHGDSMLMTPPVKGQAWSATAGPAAREGGSRGSPRHRRAQCRSRRAIPRPSLPGAA